MTVLEQAKRDRAKIHLRTAGINIVSGERDLEAIKEIEDGERILCVVTGKLVQLSNDRSRGIGRMSGGRQATQTDSKGVLVVTDRKVVFSDKRIFGEQKTIIEGEEINSVTTAKGILSAKVVIRTGMAIYDLTDVRKDATTDAVNALNYLKKVKGKATGGTTINQGTSGMDEVRKAKKLLDEGIITKQEFASIKKKHL